MCTSISTPIFFQRIFCRGTIFCSLFLSSRIFDGKNWTTLFPMRLTRWRTWVKTKDTSAETSWTLLHQTKNLVSWSADIYSRYGKVTKCRVFAQTLLDFLNQLSFWVPVWRYFNELFIKTNEQIMTNGMKRKLERSRCQCLFFTKYEKLGTNSRIFDSQWNPHVIDLEPMFWKV